ncbi:MAG: hypothetical protein IPL78_34630 [Chloroflexi bacterium]|nr:hypothetical protein [Chloroflexota bacterium]
MDQTSVAAALTFSPTVPFTLTWTTAKTVIINPTAPWPAGTDLSLNLEPTVHNEAGQRVAAAIHKPFHTGSVVTLVYVAHTRDGLDPVKINFGYDMDRASVAAAIQFDPPINATLSWGKQSHRHLTPGRLAGPTEYTHRSRPF